MSILLPVSPNSLKINHLKKKILPTFVKFFPLTYTIQTLTWIFHKTWIHHGVFI